MTTTALLRHVPAADLRPLVAPSATRTHTSERPPRASRLETLLFRRLHVKRWEIADSGHTGGLDAAPEEYERRVIDFFDRSLLDNPRRNHHVDQHHE